MCVFFRIFVCETEKEKAPIYEVQRYEEIWIHASISGGADNPDSPPKLTQNL